MFIKANKAKIKIYFGILAVSGICALIMGNAFSKSLSNILLWGPSPKMEIYEMMAGLLSLVLFLPTLVFWILFSLIKMEIVGLVIGLLLTLIYWWLYLAGLIFSFLQGRKKLP